MSKVDNFLSLACAMFDGGAGDFISIRRCEADRKLVVCCSNESFLNLFSDCEISVYPYIDQMVAEIEYNGHRFLSHYPLESDYECDL